jgi:2-aminoethylphosphonate-pyruvate transaminase
LTSLLLTPGPLTTREETRRAMLRDWGSRDGEFIALTAELRQRLLAVANAAGTHVAVPLPSSSKRPSAPWSGLATSCWC